MASIALWRIRSGGMHHYMYGHLLETLLQVDFGVSPVGPGHRAGAVWTIDGWRTVNWSSAAWQSNVVNPHGGSYEVWQLNIHAGHGSRLAPTPVVFWYALYVDDDTGVRHWDNNHGWNYEHVVS